MDGRQRETGTLKGVCHFKLIGLERIKLSFLPRFVSTVKMDRKQTWEKKETRLTHGLGVFLLTCKNP